MKTIYVVTGSCGEYSDHNEWTICGYEDEEKAKQHVVLADQYSKVCAAELERKQQEYYEDTTGAVPWPEVTNPYDPYFHTSYTGTHYTIDPVEVRDDLPEVVTN